MEKLDLPRAIGRLVAKRAVQKQREMNGAGAGEGGSSTEDVPVSFAAFYAVYGRHRPEENDRVRFFRLLKQACFPVPALNLRL